MYFPRGLFKEGMTEDSNSYKKPADSEEYSVFIMFRSTHFVILFAVVLCASALPADPSPAHETAPETVLSQKQPVQGPEGKSVPEKTDLATDAQTYWSYRYTYNTPVFGYVAPGLAARTYTLGPYSWYYGVPAPVAIIEE